MYFIEPKLENIFEQTKLIIFDMNGLIIDDEGIQRQAFNEVLKKFKLEIDENFWINQCVGHKEAANFFKIFSQKNIDLRPEKIKKLVQQKNKAYKRLIKSQIKKIIRKGILEIIEYIKEKTEKHLTLATSTTQHGCSLILGSKGLNIKDQFDFIICGEEVEKSKPDPAIYLKVKEHFNLQAKKCLVFEDASSGVEAAKNAKMLCFAVPSKYTKNQGFSRADVVISDLSREAKILF